MSFQRIQLSGKVHDTISLEDGLVLYKKTIYIPDSDDLKVKATRQCHDVKMAGQFGRDNIMQFITRTTTSLT